MHEMSLCERVLQVIEESAQQQGFTRVKGVWLEMGALALVEVGSLRLCFEVITRGTLAEGARLVVIELPGEGWCHRCAKTVRVRQRFDGCPDCGAYPLQLSGGDEMRIKELEVE